MFVGLLGLVGCETAATWPKEAPSLDGLDPVRACTAVAPRAYPCIDELYVQEMKGLIDEDAARKQIRDVQPTPEQREKLHAVNCLKDSYAPAVVTCWAKPDCKAFAECVFGETAAKPGIAPKR